MSGPSRNIVVPMNYGELFAAVVALGVFTDCADTLPEAAQNRRAYLATVQTASVVRDRLRAAMAQGALS